MFRLAGGDWVAREIVGDVQAGPRRVRDQQRRRRLVGQSGAHGRGQPVLAAGERDHARAAAAAGRRDARGRAGRPLVHRRGQSRGLGRPQDRRRAVHRALSEAARGDAGEPDLQVRLQRRPLHLPVERQVRLPLALAMGWRPAEICRADEAAAAVAGRGQGEGHRQGVHHLPLPGVRPGRAWAPSPSPTIPTR